MGHLSALSARDGEARPHPPALGGRPSPEETAVDDVWPATTLPDVGLTKTFLRHGRFIDE